MLYSARLSSYHPATPFKTTAPIAGVATVTDHTLAKNYTPNISEMQTGKILHTIPYATPPITAAECSPKLDKLGESDAPKVVKIKIEI